MVSSWDELKEIKRSLDDKLNEITTRHEQNCFPGFFSRASKVKAQSTSEEVDEDSHRTKLPKTQTDEPGTQLSYADYLKRLS